MACQPIRLPLARMAERSGTGNIVMDGWKKFATFRLFMQCARYYLLNKKDLT